MARSPLTLAAVVSSALPQAQVVAVAALTEHAAGRFDSAVADLADGTRVVIQVAEDEESAHDMRAQARALRALTSGVRALLPLRAPRTLGTTMVGTAPAVVTNLLPGYRVEAAHVPAGRGAATALGAAVASVHALPDSVVRVEQLPQRAATQVRAEVSRLLDRVSASQRVPVSLLARWSTAAAADRLWHFESTVTLGGINPEAFLIEDRDGVPEVTGLLQWGGLSVDDPAIDLRWLSSAPDAADDVFAAYCRTSVRTPDDAIRTRARLYAELEFARWLVHGHDLDDEAIVDDAVGLLTALAESVTGDDLTADAERDIDEALALLGRVPASAAARADGDSAPIALQTDAFSGDDSMLFTDAATTGTATSSSDTPAPLSTGTSAGPLPGPSTATGDAPVDPDQTAPLEEADWTGRQHPTAHTTAPADRVGDVPDASVSSDAAAEADRASTAALRRWLNAD